MTFCLRHRAPHRGAISWIELALCSCLAGWPAAGAEYPLSTEQATVGQVEIYTAPPHDILLDIARRADLGFTQLMAANPGVDPWLPGAGRKILLPTFYILPDTPHDGLVINLAAWRLFYFPPNGGRVETYPIGIGTIGSATPLGITAVIRKKANPTWYPPPSIRATEPDLPEAIGPGPYDPLGAFALYLGWPNYLIHGTNKPDGVGRNVSHGCIRLYPEDIERLFREVAIGTPVHVINQAAMAAWIGDELFVQIYPSKAQGEQIDVLDRVTPDIPQELINRVAAAAGDHTDLIDWDAVYRAGVERSGLPVVVARLPRPSSAAFSSK